jgi:hypothetical protein
MPATPAPTPADVSVTTLAAWIARLSCLRDDVGFGLDRRGVAATLAVLIDDMQDARKRGGK